MKKEKIGGFLLVSLGILAITIMFFLNPILQNEEYHSFSDTRDIFSIPNFWNVISNLLFVIVGIRGLYMFSKGRRAELQYLILCIGIILTGLGSAYYHFSPNTQSLIWDRLPMTIVFMTLFSTVISEFISKKLGNFILAPLLLIGLGSIVYWVYGETHDLRPYVLVQFYPLITILLILVFYKSNTSTKKTYWLLLISYLIAKIVEYYDDFIYYVLTIISGHSLKHIFAGLGLWVLLKSYEERISIMK
ncbi:hypothetical protein D1816_21625 [Aquimarina sp. AD10]|uniref:ceramidase domain-containing protein n=1 Tax=Aquimarina sp. AD10 TaxID=1714849 RepID=UPI000E4DF255|nr:ceramidase domain-containing protein [Aquimarina sp. AD10]AXT62831.1 hypothetical protein D1816_21625 [Aquimarina sp. AD10]RKN02015.1 hypothetical protein D7033_02990 [Aquimarina sp. AD10]